MQTKTLEFPLGFGVRFDKLTNESKNQAMNESISVYPIGQSNNQRIKHFIKQYISSNTRTIPNNSLLPVDQLMFLPDSEKTNIGMINFDIWDLQPALK